MKIGLNPLYTKSLLLHNVCNNRQNPVYNIKLSCDVINFSGNIEKKDIDVDFETAKFVANSLSSSTAGHRAVWNSKTLNPEIMKLFALGIGEYLKNNNENKEQKPKILIGGDTRVATLQSLPLIKDTLASLGLDVLYIKNPVPSPLLALATREMNADLAILLTASHNPWQDGGLNLVTNEAAIATPEITSKIADNIIDIAKRGSYTVNKTKRGEVTEVNPYELYKQTINDYNLIDWDKIANAGISIYYDGLNGTGLDVFPRLLDDYNIPYNIVSSYGQEGPNPTKENLEALKYWLLQDSSRIKVGFANDGDADRLGVIDENGNFIAASDDVLLIVKHLCDNKGLTGSIIRNQGTSSQIDLFAQNRGLEVIQTPVGFKYIGEEILNLRKANKDILVAGEESGGFTINSHIPEKDGILALLLMLDLIATENKPISQILKETKGDTKTEFRMHSFDKNLKHDKDKEVIMQRMEEVYQKALSGDTDFGGFEIDVLRTQEVMKDIQRYKKDGDGVKLYFKDGSAVLVRKSGTEPKTRVYMEAYDINAQKADNKISELTTQINKVFDI